MGYHGDCLGSQMLRGLILAFLVAFIVIHDDAAAILVIYSGAGALILLRIRDKGLRCEGVGARSPPVYLAATILRLIEEVTVSEVMFHGELHHHF